MRSGDWGGVTCGRRSGWRRRVRDVCGSDGTLSRFAPPGHRRSPVARAWRTFCAAGPWTVADRVCAAYGSRRRATDQRRSGDFWLCWVGSLIEKEARHLFTAESGAKPPSRGDLRRAGRPNGTCLHSPLPPTAEIPHRLRTIPATAHQLLSRRTTYAQAWCAVASGGAKWEREVGEPTRTGPESIRTGPGADPNRPWSRPEPTRTGPEVIPDRPRAGSISTPAGCARCGRCSRASSDRRRRTRNEPRSRSRPGSTTRCRRTRQRPCPAPRCRTRSRPGP